MPLCAKTGSTESDQVYEDHLAKAENLQTHKGIQLGHQIVHGLDVKTVVSAILQHSLLESPEE